MFIRFIQMIMNNNFDSKLAYLKWCKTMGIDYFFTPHPAQYSSKSFIAQALQNKQANLRKNVNVVNVIKEKKTSISTVVTCDDAVLSQGNHNKAKASDLNAGSNNESSSSRKLADRASTIEELRQAVMGFDECGLKNFAKNTVFSDGVESAKIMLVGEAPGAKEDEQGVPFCGESGMLLDMMLECIGLSRKRNIYITNSVFWRPPANRRPTPEEINICRPFLEKHIALIKPKLIILVGNTAATSVLGAHSGISRIRRNYYSYNNQYHTENIPTTALFHPAYLLRQPSQKKTTWFDLLKIKIFLDEGV